MKIGDTHEKRLYLQVAEKLSGQIRAGAFAEQGKLPPERELARLFSVSRPTVREAITTLEVMGLVEVRPGSGVYISEDGAPARPLPENVPGPFEETDRKFHHLIAEATRNSALAGLMNWLWDVRGHSEVNVQFYRRAREHGVRPAVEDHRKIAAALLARNAKAARNAMREHLEHAIADLSEMSLD